MNKGNSLTSLGPESGTTDALFRRTSLAAAQRTDVTDTPKERQAKWEMMVTVPTKHGSPGRMWGKSASSNSPSASEMGWTFWT